MAEMKKNVRRNANNLFMEFCVLSANEQRNFKMV